MKKVLYVLLLLIIIIVVAITGVYLLENRHSGDYTYSVSDSKAIIKVYNNRNIVGAVIIPSTLGRHAVTTIGERAFKACNNITSITIPDSVTILGDSAFEGCAGLTNITIPNSTTDIGDAAFEVCYNLKSVMIPDSVTSIGKHAFRGSGLINITIPKSVTSIGECALQCNLKSILVDANNGVYSSENDVLLNKSKTILIQYPLGKTGSYIIPDSVKSVGNFAFQYCSYLTSVTIPSSVTSIGYDVFSDYATIFCYKDTYAQTYAISNNIPYELLD